MLYVFIIVLHVGINMLHVDRKKSHVNMIMLPFDISYFACKEQKSATIIMLHSFMLHVHVGAEVCHYRLQ